MSSEAIAPGTPCYLIGLSEMQELNGHVVEVIAGPMQVLGEQGDWFAVDAAWIRELFPGGEAIAPRRNLMPITAPGLAPPAARKRTPENVF